MINELTILKTLQTSHHIDTLPYLPIPTPPIVCPMQELNFVMCNMLTDTTTFSF